MHQGFFPRVVGQVTPGGNRDKSRIGLPNTESAGGILDREPEYSDIAAWLVEKNQCPVTIGSRVVSNEAFDRLDPYFGAAVAVREGN